LDCGGNHTFHAIYATSDAKIGKLMFKVPTQYALSSCALLSAVSAADLTAMAA
jgi:hypothetical protein